MSKTQSFSVYQRDVVWVSAHPRQVRLHRLGGDVMGSQKWMLSSVVAAVVQTDPKGVRCVAVREDNDFFDFQPGKMALEELNLSDAETVKVLGPEAFDDFVSIYTAGINNLDALRKVIPAIERYAPIFRFMPKHLHHLLTTENADTQSYKHMPRMFLRYDLSEYEAIVWLNRASGQVSPKLFPKWNINPSTTLHVGGAWYAFKSMDDAVGAKFLATQTEIYRLRDE